MTESSSLNDYLSNIGKDHRMTSEQVLDSKKEEVLLLIANKGVVYSTEIARILDIDIDGVNKILYDYKKKGFIEKIQPHPTVPQPMFQKRIPEMWAMGIWGYGRFIQFSWWTLTVGGFEYLSVKYKGQHKPISPALCEYLDLKEKEEFKEEQEKPKISERELKEIDKLLRELKEIDKLFESYKIDEDETHLQ